MKRTAQEVAQYVQGELHGDGSTLLSSVASLRNAGPADLSYAEDKFEAHVTASGAGCVIVSAGKFAGKTVIAVKTPKVAFARAAQWLLAAEPDQAGIHPSAVVAPDASIGENVKIGAGAVIESAARVGDATVIEAGCCVGANARIGMHCRLYPRVVLYAGVHVGDRVTIHAGAVIGADGFGYVKDGEHYVKFPQAGSVMIEDDVEIGANTCIDRGSLETTIIRRGSKIDNLVQIAHNVEIGEHTVIASQTGISGSATVGAHAVIGGQTGIGEHARLEDYTVIGGQGGVLNRKRVRGGVVLWGTPVRPLKEVLEQQAALARLPKLLKEVAELKKAISQQTSKS